MRASLLAGLDSVDIGLGLSRVLGKVDLYLSLLGRFARDQRDAASRLREAIAAGDFPVAERLAHTAKSTAANIGAEGLREKAAALEAAVRAVREAGEASGGGAAEVSDSGALGDFEAALTQLVAELDDALPQLAPPRRGAEAGAAAETEVARLAALLKEGDAEAAAFYREAETKIATAYPTVAARLKRGMESFDFDAALAALGEALRASGREDS